MNRRWALHSLAYLYFSLWHWINCLKIWIAWFLPLKNPASTIAVNLAAWSSMFLNNSYLFGKENIITWIKLIYDSILVKWVMNRFYKFWAFIISYRKLSPSLSSSWQRSHLHLKPKYFNRYFCLVWKFCIVNASTAKLTAISSWQRIFDTAIISHCLWSVLPAILK